MPISWVAGSFHTCPPSPSNGPYLSLMPLPLTHVSSSLLLPSLSPCPPSTPPPSSAPACSYFTSSPFNHCHYLHLPLLSGPLLPLSTTLLLLSGSYSLSPHNISSSLRSSYPSLLLSSNSEEVREKKNGEILWLSAVKVCWSLPTTVLL